MVQGRARTGLPLAVNGVFGNMGVACAALVTGFLIDAVGWRSAFLLPGLLCVAIGAGYGWFVARGRAASFQADASKAPTAVHSATTDRRILLRAFAVVLFTTATGGLIFQSTTFTLPKVFDEGLTGLAGSATAVGWYAFLVFSVAAVAQLVVGYFVDRHSLRRVFAVVAFLQMVFLGLMTQADGPMIVVVAIAFMLAVFGQIPINDVLVGRLARSEWRSPRLWAALPGDLLGHGERRAPDRLAAPHGRLRRRVRHHGRGRGGHLERRLPAALGQAALPRPETTLTTEKCHIF